MATRTAVSLLLAALMLAPVAAADPVSDMYEQLQAFERSLDHSLEQAADAVGGSGQQLAYQTLGIAGTVVALAGGAAGGLPAGPQLTLREWVGLGEASGTMTTSSAAGNCSRMTVLVEIRPALSQEPTFVINLANGEGTPTLTCLTGLRNAFPPSAWSGDAARGWHARVTDTPDALVIDVTVGPRGPDGSRPLAVYWDAGVNGVVGLFVLQGSVTDVVAV